MSAETMSDRPLWPISAGRTWWLEMDAAGTPFIWSGQADSESEAVARARTALASKCICSLADCERAQLVACIET